MKILLLAATVLSVATVSAQQSARPTAVDWRALRQEVLDRYRDLVRIDSTAGRETLVVDYLRKVLEAEGIPTKTFALDPARANLVARIRGNGTKRPLLILAHTDVVGVQREKWPVDPFGAVMKDGYIWGRGTQGRQARAGREPDDDAAAQAARRDRSIATSSSSPNRARRPTPTGAGINFMVREHFDEIDAEFAMTEGGGATLDDGERVVRVNIGTAEKLPARARLVATGTAGHGSVPRLDNPLVHLGAALEKVGRWATPMRLNDTTRAYFEGLARAAARRARGELSRRCSTRRRRAEAAAFLRANVPAEYSMLRTSVVPTMLKAGVGANVIPSEAEATLDIRALPGEDIAAFYAEMEQVIADPAVKVVPIPAIRPPSPASRIETEMFRVMARVAQTMYPGAAVLPSMSTGASDQAQLRAKGIQSYGIGPAATEADSLNYPAHGDVERLAESSLYPFVEYVWNVVTEVAGRQVTEPSASAPTRYFTLNLAVSDKPSCSVVMRTM